MATTETPAELTELYPFEEQEPFLKRDKKYYGYVSGVGAGKTYAGMLRTVLNAEEWNPGEMHAIVAPTTTMIKDVIIPLFREAGILDHWEYRGMHSDEPGLHAPNGSRVLMLSADNRRTIERLAGLNLASWWLDEASRVPHRALEILEQRLRVGRYRNGYITTTPMGQDHVYDFFVGGHDGGTRYDHVEADIYETEDRLAILHVPTWANPHTAEDYKQQMEAKEGQTYEREILGRFVDYEGLVYPWFNPEDHIIDTHEIPEKSLRATAYGVDWGYNNPSVILALRFTHDGTIYVRECFYESGVTVDDMAEVLGRMEQEHGRGRVFCDPAEPASIDTLQRHGHDAVGAENALMPGIQHVTARRSDINIERHCAPLIDEFTSYRYPDGGDGEKPVDANNHACDAIRYILFTRSERGGQSLGIAGVNRGA